MLLFSFLNNAAISTSYRGSFLLLFVFPPPAKIPRRASRGMRMEYTARALSRLPPRCAAALSAMARSGYAMLRRFAITALRDERR